MIHCRVTKDSSSIIDGIHISVTSESILNFLTLVNRALNCWDSAPAELKELGDMLSHGRITQEHKLAPINSTRDSNSDYTTLSELALIQDYIAREGLDAYRQRIIDGTWHKVLKKEV